MAVQHKGDSREEVDDALVATHTPCTARVRHQSRSQSPVWIGDSQCRAPLLRRRHDREGRIGVDAAWTPRGAARPTMPRARAPRFCTSGGTPSASRTVTECPRGAVSYTHLTLPTNR